MATITSLLADHVMLKVRSVDRLVLAGYVPRLQCAGQLVGFFQRSRGRHGPVAGDPRRGGRVYLAAVDEFALNNELAVVRFKRHECKEDVARSYFQRAERDGRFGVVLIGVAQQKASAWRGWREGDYDRISSSLASRCSSTTSTSTSATGSGPRRPRLPVARVRALRNDKVRRLARLMPIATPVQVVR